MKNYYKIEKYYEDKVRELELSVQETELVVYRINAIKYKNYIDLLDSNDFLYAKTLFNDAIEYAMKETINQDSKIVYGYTISGEVNFVLKGVNESKKIDVIRNTNIVSGRFSTYFHLYIDRYITDVERNLDFRCKAFVLNYTELNKYLSHRQRFRRTTFYSDLALATIPIDFLDPQNIFHNVGVLKRMNTNLYERVNNEFRFRNGFDYSRPQDDIKVNLNFNKNTDETYLKMLSKPARNKVIARLRVKSEES